MTNAKFKHFVRFILDRELLRQRKEDGKKPWTKDPILAKFHFCNINREDDYVTKWIRQNVSLKYASKHFGFMVVQLLACRIFNEPEVLDEILPIEDVDDTFKIMKARRKNGESMFRGAYMVAAHGTSIPAYEYYCRVLREAQASVSEKRYMPATLREVALRLEKIKGIGDFIINQVCADLRHTYPRSVWEDATTFVWAGPGTRRGLNRLHGRDVDDGGSRKDLSIEVCQIQQTLQERFEGYYYLQKTFTDPNNVANSLCEYDKYCRAQDMIRAGEAPRLRRKYTPNPSL